jgi:hypothetical protein
LDLLDRTTRLKKITAVGLVGVVTHAHEHGLREGHEMCMYRQAQC